MRLGALVLLLAAPAAAAAEGLAAPAACRGCHPDHYRSYLETGMGRSFSPAGSPEPLERYYHAASQRHYSVVSRGGIWFLRRHQIGYGGAETNVVEKQIHYVIGSGNHARTYLHRSDDGRLVELPLSWYSAQGGYWAMSPGYDRPDHDDFRRRAGEACLFCHSASAAGEAIGCARCHGPGEAHVRASQAGRSAAAVRAAVLNPARMSPARRLEVCLQCHLETTSRPLPNAIRRYDRQPFSYRPGEPLAGYLLHFDHAAGSGRGDKFEVNHAGYRFLQSRCYTESRGTMTCTTCHDPHRARRGPQAAEHYSKACRSCHAGKLAEPHPAGQDCAACHMPKRRAEDAVHVVVTDHRIARRPPAEDPAAPLDELDLARKAAYNGEVALYNLPSAPDAATARLYRAVAQVKDLANLTAGIPLLARAIAELDPKPGEFYLELGEAYARTGETGKAIEQYRLSTRRAPGLVRAHYRLGETLLRAADSAAAVAALEKALALSPADTGIATALGVAYGQAGRLGDSIRQLENAVRSNPDHPMAWLNLSVSLEQSGDHAAAEQACRSAIRAQPDFGRAHGHLANLLAATGEEAQASYHRQQALR